MRPMPRTPLTNGYFFPSSPSCRRRYSPCSRQFSSTPSLSNASCTASAAAETSAVPPKVLAWVPGVSVSAYLRFVMKPPIGRPFAIALAIENASGSTPKLCQAKRVPIRPMPHCTSSKSSRMSFSSQSARTCFRYSRSAGRMPPSPCTGSRTTAQVLSLTAFFSASISLNGTCRKPGISGSKPLRYFARPVAASVARVRPWNELSIEMISLRPEALPILRASLNIPSLASAPELAKNTTPSKQFSISFSARRGMTSFI